MCETVNKEECGKCKNTNQKNTEDDFQCKNASENKSTKRKKTDNEKNKPINDNSDDDKSDKEEINTPKSTSEALSVSNRGCYLVPVWALIERAGNESFPNACQVAAELKCAYDAVCGLQPDKLNEKDVKALTDMATSALSALRNAHTGQSSAGQNTETILQNYREELSKYTSHGKTRSDTASVTSLLSLLFLCSTQAACFVPTAENSHSTDEKQHTVSQVTVERCEAQADINADDVGLTAASDSDDEEEAASAADDEEVAAVAGASALADTLASALVSAVGVAAALAAPLAAVLASAIADFASAVASALAANTNADADATIASDVGIPDDIDASNAVGAQTPQTHDESVAKVNEPVKNLLLCLGLTNYFPKRLDRSQFHAVRFEIINKGADQPVPPNKLVSQFIHMLRAADSNIRHLGYSENTDDEESGAEGEGPVHPVDLLLAVFLCADDLMRQHMFLRLSAAQLALPFVIPMPHSAGLEMPLWPFRVVLKSVLSSTTQGKQARNELSVCDAKFPIVCFVRYGQFELSKSRIENKVLDCRNSDVFFDRECNNNAESRVLMDGLAEIYWYCPSGKKEEERFNTFAAFVNLCGGAFEHHQLAAYLHDIASVNVIFCTKANHEKMNADITGVLKEKPLIWVSPDMKSSKEEQKKVIQFKSNYDAATVNKLRESIKVGLEDPVKKCSLIEFAEHGQQKHGINVDDGCKECIKAKRYANDIIQIVKKVNPENAKEKLLPLSNNLWKSWCEEDMKSAHLKGNPDMSVEQCESEIKKQKSIIRQKQAEKAKKSGFLTTFMDKLRSPSPKGRLFFLRWLEMWLNARSRERLAELRAEWAALENLIYQLRQSKESKNLTILKTLMNELDDLSQKINAYTFGLEHCLREVAQMYEAMRSQGREDCNDLPRIAAELLRDGEPLELMDGDACYVPLDWVGAVLKELHKMVRGKKLFVLSVLGIQSSGKSTLLNTMFGLRFAVSAGRCTRGAFMQLVEIAEEHTGELKYDYVLVIDTEGLRSQELSEKRSTERDNKMAALVIGLANMTLINVTGENVLEVKDFLQIAVHAFLRMRKVKLAPGCVFVHQNVSAADAEDKNMLAKSSLTKQLDEMTAETCKQEGSSVQCFGDVIKSGFKPSYFSSLFMGDPPMAPLNPSYGTKACEVRNVMLKGARGPGVLSVSDFSIRIRDLWMALRGENFVFGFKNTLEICAYRKLETKRTELDRNMRHGFVDPLRKLRNKAEKGDFTEAGEKEIKGDADISKLLQMAKKECEKFFEDEEERDTLGQWHDNTIIHLEDYFDERVTEAVREVNNYIKKMKCLREAKKTVEKYEKEIIEKNKDLAKKNQGNVNEVEGRKLFNDMFEKYLEKVEMPVLGTSNVDFEYDARVLLRARFPDMPEMESKVNQVGKKSEFVVDISIHLLVHGKIVTGMDSGDARYAKSHVERSYEDLVQMATKYIDDQVENDYSKDWFETITEDALKKIKQINNTSAGKKN